MNIVIVGTAHPHRGAFAQLNTTLAWHLSKRHSVQIVSFKRQYPEFLFPGKTQIDPSKPLFSVRIHALIDSINPWTWFLAARFIADQRPDLLIFRYWMPFFAPCFAVISSLARKWSKAKVMFICDNVIAHERRPGDLALTRLAFRFVDFFVVQSKSVERELLSIMPNARHVVTPHPIYNIFGREIPKTKARKQLGIATRRVILFFGYVRAYKGLGVLLEAMPLVLKQVDATLLVVGEFYENEDRYKHMIAAAHLEDRVILHSDYVPNDEVARYFSAADAVILPYTSATQSGIVQIANHFEKPVIATNIGGLAEDVVHERTGLIVEPRDPKALADAIVRFFKKKLEPGFIRNIRKLKKKHGWDVYAEALQGFMK